MGTPRLISFVILLLLFFSTGSSLGDEQGPMSPAVKYAVISQRWLSPKELSRFQDVSGLVLAVRMRLSNESDWYIKYPARSTGSILPEGYHYFRKVGEKHWQSLPPSRGRVGDQPGPEFSGDGIRWLELAPYASVEFEILNWSNAAEEHCFSTFVKTDENPTPIEEKSNIFRPLTK
jgi:hypothetical protein